MSRLTTPGKILAVLIFIVLPIAGLIWWLPSCNTGSNDSQRVYVEGIPETPATYDENYIDPDFGFSQAQAQLDFETGYRAGWNGMPLHAALFQYHYTFQPSFFEGWQVGWNSRGTAWNSYNAFSSYWLLLRSKNVDWAWQRAQGYYSYVQPAYRSQVELATTRNQHDYERNLEDARQRVATAQSNQQAARQQVEEARHNVEVAKAKSNNRGVQEAVKDMDRDFSIQDQDRYHGDRYKELPKSEPSDYGNNGSNPFGKKGITTPSQNDYGNRGKNPFGKKDVAVPTRTNDYGNGGDNPFGGTKKMDTPKIKPLTPTQKPKGRY